MPSAAFSRRHLSSVTLERSVSFMPSFRALLVSRYCLLCCCCRCGQVCADLCPAARSALMPSWPGCCSTHYEQPLFLSVSYPVSLRCLFSTAIWHSGYFGQSLSLRLPFHFSGRLIHHAAVQVMTTPPNPYPLQRTAPCVTAPASAAAFPPAMQVPRRTPRSLSLGSLGRFARIRLHI